MSKSPTEYSLKKWRDKGAIVEKAEYYQPFYSKCPRCNKTTVNGGIRKDLLGIVDLVAIHEGVTYWIQVTSYSNVSARVKKISKEKREVSEAVLSCSSNKILVEGWHQPGGPRTRWKCREVEITLENINGD